MDLGYDPPLLVTNLTSAVVQASITGKDRQNLYNGTQITVGGVTLLKCLGANPFELLILTLH